MRSPGGPPRANRALPPARVLWPRFRRRRIRAPRRKPLISPVCFSGRGGGDMDTCPARGQDGNSEDTARGDPGGCQPLPVSHRPPLPVPEHPQPLHRVPKVAPPRAVPPQPLKLTSLPRAAPPKWLPMKVPQNSSPEAAPPAQAPRGALPSKPPQKHLPLNQIHPHKVTPLKQFPPKSPKAVLPSKSAPQSIPPLQFQDPKAVSPPQKLQPLTLAPKAELPQGETSNTSQCISKNTFFGGGSSDTPQQGEGPWPHSGRHPPGRTPHPSSAKIIKYLQTTQKKKKSTNK